MKKTLIICLVIVGFIACDKKETKQGNLHITGNIDGLSQGKLYIQKVKDTSLIVLDSIIFKGNSNFESYITIDEPEVLYLFLDRGQTNSIDNSLSFFAEPGEMTINSKLKEFFSAAKISGSKNQELWEEFKTMNSKFTNANLDIVAKQLENDLNFDSKRQDSINEAYNKLLKRKYLYTTNFASNHSDYEIAPYLALSEIANINVSLLDTIANKMSPKVAESKYGKILQQHIAETKNTK